ncbi:Hypothetical protein A7982_07400 [Minicystis rosea]|nr:Hypothetical protein A7982_07400 [Minicystis rosea]
MASDRARQSLSFLAGALVLAASAACGDPARSNAADALGPEVAGVEEGPLHRAGQPCLVCHDGSRSRPFSLAGTVYLTPDSDAPAVGAAVRWVDAEGRSAEARTNCAGNFFVLPEDFTPTYPLWVSVTVGSLEVAMDSPINGNGSCAHCHGLSTGPQSTGRVYAYPIAPSPLPPGCP